MRCIWLDDFREAPEDWERTYWPDEMIEKLQDNNVDVISLDHDLGNDERGTGYDVLVWALMRGCCPDNVRMVTSNPVGRDRMIAALESEGYEKCGPWHIRPWPTEDEDE